MCDLVYCSHLKNDAPNKQKQKTHIVFSLHTYIHNIDIMLIYMLVDVSV